MFGNSNSYSIRKLSNPSGWIIKIKIHNVWFPPSAITSVFIDDVQIPNTNYRGTCIIPGKIYTSIPDSKTGIPLEEGDVETINIYISDTDMLIGSKDTVNIKLHSINGADYGQQFTLYKSRIFPSSEIP